MNKALAFGLAAAAAVIVAILGFRFLVPASPSIGGPTEPPSPTVSPTPAATTPQMPAAGDLDAGTYRVSRDTPRPYTVTVPAGWNTEEGFINKGDSEAVVDGDVFVGSWIITHVFEDACLRPESDAEGLVEARTPAAITEALAAQGGHETVGPSAQTLGGYPAQLLEFRVPADFDIATCGGIIRLWPGAGPDLSSGQLAAAAAAYGPQVLGMSQFWWCVAAIPLIGMLNLGVSFYFAFRLALRAHSVDRTDRRRIGQALRARWLRRPASFFLPT